MMVWLRGKVLLRRGMMVSLRGFQRSFRFALPIRFALPRLALRLSHRSSSRNEIRRLHHAHFPPNYFTQKPLNYETYTKRLAAFNLECPSGTLATSLLLDLIRANRSLQSSARDIHITANHDDFLGITTQKTSHELDDDLFELLFTSHHGHQHDQIIISYLFTAPRPHGSIDKILSVMSQNFHYNLSHHRKINHDLVRAVLNYVLGCNDYYNSIKLIDLTVNHSAAHALISHKFWVTSNWLIAATLATSSIEWFVCPLLPFYAYALTNAVACLGLAWCFIRLNLIDNLGRISWRHYNSTLYRAQHQHEIRLINKVITYFEEHNEVNIRNFHHSKVRKMSSLNIFKSNSYVIELPDNEQLMLLPEQTHSHSSPLGKSLTPQEETEIVKLQKYFKQQLGKRRLAINDLQEELMFLEFWLTHGENYEWVEPDQDPAELIRFITRSSE